MGVPVERLNKLGEGSPHVLDWIERGDVDLVVNTPTGVGARTDGWEIRRAAVAHGIPCLTTLSAGGERGARDRRRAARRRPGGAVPAGAARGQDRVSEAPTSPARSLAAPFGRRLSTVTGIDELGATACCGSPIPDRLEPPAPPPAGCRVPASSRCWRRPSAGAGERTSGPIWRARSRSPAAATERPTTCWRTSGRAPGGCASWGPATAVGARPARAGLHRAAGRSAGAARRRRRRDRAAGDLQDELARRGHPGAGVARLPRRPARAGRGAAAASAGGDRRRLGRPPRARHRPARGGARPRRARDRLRLRAGADAGGRQGDLRDARDPGAARAGGGDGLRVRRLLRVRRAAAGRRLSAGVRRRTGDRRGGAGSGRGPRRRGARDR